MTSKLFIQRLRNWKNFRSAVFCFQAVESYKDLNCVYRITTFYCDHSSDVQYHCFGDYLPKSPTFRSRLIELYSHDDYIRDLSAFKSFYNSLTVYQKNYIDKDIELSPLVDIINTLNINSNH